MTQTGNYTADERAAMRAYLQRAEVRLSTMHRVAGVFLNGAGLLFLLPVLFRDVVKDIVALILSKGYILLDNSDIRWLYYLALAVPFLLSMYIPLRALYLLLKDLVDFYFVGHSPGFSSRLFNPRFVLSGIAFSPDEGEEAKQDIILNEYSDLLHFVLPFEESQAAYFGEVKDDSGDLIIPETRTKDILDKMGVLRALPAGRTYVDVERFSVAFGLAGVVDRSLIQEVAKTETSLVRHALSLRRLVLRYAKALLAVVWTTLISFFIVSLSGAFDKPVALIAICYLVWALSMRPIVKLPIRWIYQMADQNSPTRVSARDAQLVKFEREVTIICAIAAVISAAMFVLSFF